MWWFAAVQAAAQVGDGCARTSVGHLGNVAGPAVVVLGERKGTLTDLYRARRVVRALAERGPVTLALQAVRVEHQDALDRLGSGELSVAQLPEALEWSTSWGFPFEPYGHLFGLAKDGVKFVGIGAPYRAPAADAAVDVPPGYLQVLLDPMGENRIPTSFEERYPRFVASADQAMARAAVDAWSGEGVLVILVDRFHLEGGLGVQWQADQRVDAPVHSALLANAASRCYPGDQIVSFLGL